MTNISLVDFNSFHLRSSPPPSSDIFNCNVNIASFTLYNQDLYLISVKSSIDLNSERFAQFLFANSYHVLIKITSLSTNFRDRGDLEIRLRNPAISNYFIGSDFVATVLLVGSSVDNLKVSDRVIPSHCFPGKGLVSVTASTGLLMVDSRLLVSIDSSISDPIAASFSVPYQTASSLIRRSGVLSSCKHALVTAPNSATSLAIIQLLILHKVPFTVLARSELSSQQLSSFSVDNFIIANPHSESFNSQLSIGLSGLNISHVFDNFPDVYAPSLVPHVGYACRYMFAGLLDQGVYFQDPTFSSLSFSKIIHIFMMKNIQFVGNCLGSHSDLLSALQLLSSNKISPTIDSIFPVHDIDRFITRSFSSGRSGKSVLSLNAS